MYIHNSPDQYSEMCLETENILGRRCLLQLEARRHHVSLYGYQRHISLSIEKFGAFLHIK